MSDPYYGLEGDRYVTTGPRREPPGLCRECGEPAPDAPFFGDRTCGAPRCRDRAAERQPVSMWLAGKETR